MQLAKQSSIDKVHGLRADWSWSVYGSAWLGLAYLVRMEVAWVWGLGSLGVWGLSGSWARQFSVHMAAVRVFWVNLGLNYALSTWPAIGVR